MEGIFEGVRVVELAEGLAARYATMYLADHGADVVKLEPEGTVLDPGEPGLQTVDRGKRSVTFAAAADRRRVDVAAAAPLIATADLLVTDRPGEATELRRHNPHAVIVAMPPWGERGPLVDAPASPDLVAAVTGIFWNQQSYQEAPVHVVVPLVAYATGVLGALTAAAGLLARTRHGCAPTYEASWVAGATVLQLEQFRTGDEVEERPGSAPMGSKGRVPVYRLFEAADGRWFFLACGTPRFYERMMAAIGRADLLGDPRLPSPPWGLMDLDALAFIVPLLEAAFATKPRDEWLALLAEADVPAQPVLTREEFLQSTIAEANGLDVAVEHPVLGEVRMMGLPLVCEAAPGEVRRRAPLPGEHTAELAPSPVPPAPASASLAPAAGAVPGQGRPPLEGIEVLDLSSFIAGPLVSRHLAMLGASVIKLEAPTGDPFRAFGAAFACWNQGKRSIAADLTTSEGHELLVRLAQRADAVVENARPGVAERLGSDAATLRAVNPRLVYLSSTGYGDDRSMAPAPAFDPLMQALGGIMAAQGGVSAEHPTAEPVFLTVPVHDYLTPLISAFGVVAALYHRERTGQGQRVRTSLARATMAAQVSELTRFAGRAAPLLGGWDFPGPSPEHGCVEDGDGGWSFVHGAARLPIERFGVVNAPVVVENDLLATHDHPEFGTLTAPGQVVGGAGPHPARGPLLDEHRHQILAELDER